MLPRTSVFSSGVIWDPISIYIQVSKHPESTFHPSVIPRSPVFFCKVMVWVFPEDIEPLPGLSDHKCAVYLFFLNFNRLGHFNRLSLIRPD
jgi:hypothetical protein